MKSDIEEVIEAYELEKQELEKQIADYVEEGDYLNAHHHNRALRRINDTLSILKDLQNPLYSSISEQEMRILSSKKMLAAPLYQGLGDYILNQIKESEEKILELRRVKVKDTYDSQEIDDALFDLEKGSINGFDLYFKSSQDLYLTFTMGMQNIEIALICDTSTYNSYEYIFKEGNQLKALGFNIQEGQWVYRYHFTQFKDAWPIKIILAHLIYDIFRYDRRFDSARIVYH